MPVDSLPQTTESAGSIDPATLTQTQFINRPLSLISTSGAKYTIKLNHEILSDYGYSENETQLFKIGDLREYIFDNWNDITSSSDDKSIELPDQIQLLHFGKRLDPNLCLSSLDIETSPVFHVIIKDKDTLLNQNDSSNASKIPLKIFRNDYSNNKKTNKPVPQFNQTHIRSNSVADSTIRKRSTTSPINNSESQNEIVCKDKNNLNTTPTVTNKKSQQQGQHQQVTQSSKSSCCIIA